MKNKLSLLVSTFAISLTLATPQLAQASDEVSPFQGSSQNVRKMIVEETAFYQASRDIPLANLAFVNTEWLEIIKELKNKVGGHVWKALQGVKDEKDEGIYQTFLNGKLVYRPDINSNEGMIEWEISDFPNSFEGTFDLSQCGNTVSDLKITTNPTTFFEIEKVNPKVNILIAPYFLINKLIDTDSKPFEKIMKKWNKDEAPIGMFWRWYDDSDAKNYLYLTSVPLETMVSRNLRELARRTQVSGRLHDQAPRCGRAVPPGYRPTNILWHPRYRSFGFTCESK